MYSPTFLFLIPGIILSLTQSNFSDTHSTAHLATDLTHFLTGLRKTHPGATSNAKVHFSPIDSNSVHTQGITFHNLLAKSDHSENIHQRFLSKLLPAFTTEDTADSKSSSNQVNFNASIKASQVTSLTIQATSHSFFTLSRCLSILFHIVSSKNE